MASELLLFDHPAAPGAQAGLRVSLDFSARSKARLRTRAHDGREIAIVVERGRVLRGGTHLAGPHGEVLAIEAAAEPLSQVHGRDARELTRAAYHLGNRHVSLEVGDGCLRYLADHVLDEMVRGLGLKVAHMDRPFEPEAGAYGAHHHGQHEHSHA